jgi:hypothetical protein
MLVTFLISVIRCSRRSSSGSELLRHEPFSLQLTHWRRSYGLFRYLLHKARQTEGFSATSHLRGAGDPIRLSPTFDVKASDVRPEDEILPRRKCVRGGTNENCSRCCGNSYKNRCSNKKEARSGTGACVGIPPRCGEVSLAQQFSTREYFSGRRFRQKILLGLAKSKHSGRAAQ